MMDTDRNGKDTPLLAGLAERLREDPHYMAYVLATYQQRMGLDDEALAGELRTSPEMIVRLAMCKRPDVTSASYERDLHEMSEYTLADETFLSQVIQRCCSLDADNIPAGSRLQNIRVPSRVRGSFVEQVRSTFTRHALTFVCSFALLMIVGSVLFWRQSLNVAAPSLVADGARTDSPPADPPMASAADVLPDFSDPGGTQDQSGDRSRSRGASRHQPTNGTVMVNLDDRSSLREAVQPDAQAQKVIRLPLPLTTVLFRLARGSRPGDYSVSIVDAFGEPVFNTKQSSSGKSLRAVVDTRGLLPGEYSLCVRRESEDHGVPDCVPVRIDGSRTHIDKPR